MEDPDQSADAGVVIQHAEQAEIDAENIYIGEVETAEVHAEVASIAGGIGELNVSSDKVSIHDASNAEVHSAVANIGKASKAQVHTEVANITGPVQEMHAVIGEVGAVVQNAQTVNIDAEHAMVFASQGEINVDAQQATVHAGQGAIVNIAQAGTVVMQPPPDPSDEEICKYERQFEEEVVRRTRDQTSGGVIDSFKKRNLMEPSDEFTPRIKIVDFFGGGMVQALLQKFRGKPKEYVKESAFAVTGAQDRSKEVTEKIIGLQEFLSAEEGEKRRALVGQAGSGKTTLMKRIARGILNGNLVLEYTDAAGDRHQVTFVHFLNIRDIPETEGSEKISSQQMLFGKVMPKVDKKVIKYGFEWLMRNDEKAVFVLDGLDQASWKLPDRYKKKTYTDESDTATLMANILSGDLFPRSNVIFSSREHSVAGLNVKMRPDPVASLAGLSMKDRRGLFIQLAGEDGEELWERMCREAPALVQLASVPLFLVFIVIVYKHDPTNPPDTLTGIIVIILQIFMRSDHSQEIRSNMEIINKLKILAYKGTKKGKVLFKMKHLEELGLNSDWVKDLIIQVPGSTMLSQCLMDVDQVLCFCHQAIQEMLTALYVSEMPMAKFKKFIRKHLYDEHWSVVRRFLFGLLLNQQTRKTAKKDVLKVSSRGIQEKANVLKESIHDQFKKTKQSSVKLELYACLYESSDVQFIQSFVHKVEFERKQFIPSDIHLLSTVIRRCQKISTLQLSECALDSEVLSVLKHGLGEKNVQVPVFDVSGNANMGVEGFGSVGEIVRDCAVRRLILQRCSVQSAEIQGLEQILHEGTLKELDVSGNKKMDSNVFAALGTLASTSRLEELIMERWSIKFSLTDDIDELSVVGAETMNSDDNNNLGTFISGYSRSANGKGKFSFKVEKDANKITKLDVSWNENMGTDGFSALGEIVLGCGVSDVGMCDCNISSDEMRSFQKSVAGAKITKLDVSWNKNMGTDGFSALGEIILGCGVSDVAMWHCNTSPNEMRTLQTSVAGAKITKLDVFGNENMGTDGFSALGDIILGCGVSDVPMSHCNISPDEMRSLQKCVAGAKITKLNVSGNTHMVTDGFSALGDIILGCGVSDVAMRNCNISSDEMRSLQKCVAGAKITKLDVSLNGNMGTDGFSVLGEIILGCGVSDVDMRECDISSDEMRSLQKSVAGAKIKRLDVSGSIFSASALGTDLFKAITAVAKQSQVEELVVLGYKFSAGQKQGMIEELGKDVKNIF